MHYTIGQVKEALIEMVPAAARHNATIRPTPTFQATVAMIDSGEYTLIAALYVEIDERFARADVEQAIIELSREGRAIYMPESAQGDLTEYDRMLALRAGGQEHHWIKITR